MKNPEKFREQNRKNVKNHREKYKGTLTDTERAIQRSKNALNNRKLRLRRKAAKIQAECKVENKEIFSTPQMKGKAIKRCRTALPQSDQEKKAVLDSLMSELKPDATKLRESRFELQEVNKKVTDFYLYAEISRSSPNIKDFKKIYRNGGFEMVSVKHMLLSIREAHAAFCSENPDVNISFSKFYALKPSFVLPVTKLPHNVCCCEIHENLRCALKSLKKNVTELADIYTDYGMHRNFVCNDSSDDCFLNKCEVCGNAELFKIQTSLITDQDKNLKWMKWIKASKQSSENESTSPYCNVEKIQKSGSVRELLHDIFAQSSSFLDHEFVKKCQSTSCDRMISDSRLKNSANAVIICDFAEKFKCIPHNATQTSNYGPTPVSIFTVALYHRSLFPIVIASDVEKQTKDCVLAFLTVVFDRLPQTVESVSIWTDNASSQFKNQFIMSSLKTFEIKYKVKISWNFFAAMHGKSVVDGFGGSVKRFVRRRIDTNEFNLVNNAKDFVAACNGMNIEVVLCNPDDISKRNYEIDLKGIIKSAKKVTDIKKNHFFGLKEIKIGKRCEERVVGEKTTPFN
jgi:hypothetical protein